MADWGSTAGSSGPDSSESFSIDRTFAKGAALGDWLAENGASDGDSITLTDYAYSLDAATDKSQQWIYGSDSNPVKYLTFNTPVNAEEDAKCGRAVISDIHVSSAGDDSNLPGSCDGGNLTDQEKALLFLLMDLSSCVQSDDTEPTPPN